MKKQERQNQIIKLLEKQGKIMVSEIVEELQVSDMTVRRDLDELEAAGRLKRVHGGAQSYQKYTGLELTHEQKKVIHVAEKNEIVRCALSLIQEGDTLFLGTGTTIEMLAKAMDFQNVHVVTNSLPVFLILDNKLEEGQLFLTGGEFRKKTGAFYGELAERNIRQLRFAKSFISANAINEDHIMTTKLAEGTTEHLAFDAAREKYLLVDSSKFNKEDFNVFYSLKNITAVLTNEDNDVAFDEFEQYTKILFAKEFE
ncbi:MAG: DeoR/GlpR family DNA-binding transcription regulator [Lactobacillales bacterium]|nr:DeoR/GlpR family DNA-binding transcription regulator [Lactobacillales bacterium]